jgi:hypothetical protein
MTAKEHVKFIDGKPIQVPRHGGRDARRWRRAVANSAAKPPSPELRTFSFPLDCELPTAAFGAANALYNTAEGTGPGSLLNLLLRLHLAGVGLFQGVKEAESFRNAAAFPDAAFTLAIQRELGLNIPKLTPRNLLNVLKTVPRGDAPAFDVPTVANRIHASCFGKRMDDRTDTAIRMFFERIAEPIIRYATDYKDLASKATSILESIGERVREMAPSAPSLAITLTASGNDLPLYYTGEVDPVEAEEPREFWLHHVIACLLRKNPDAKPGEVQDAVLSMNNNALSKLFGVALFDGKGADGALRKMTVSQLQQALGVPADRLSDLEALRDAIQAIQSPPLFDERHYADYRPAVGGKLRSWIANYLTRLEILQKQLESIGDPALPETIDPEIELIASGLRLQIDDVRGMVRDRHAVASKALECVRSLRGHTTDRRPIESAVALDRHLNSIRDLQGHLESIANQVRQLLEREGFERLHPWATALEAGDAGLFALPRISGGTDDVTKVLAELSASTTRLLANVERLRGVVGSSSGCERLAGVLSAYEQDERVRARALPGRSLTDSQVAELAKRRLLSSIARLASRLSPSPAAILWHLLERLLVDDSGPSKKTERVFNRLRYNRQGRLYVSPWSPARHEPLAIRWSEFGSRGWVDDIDRLVEMTRQSLRVKPSGEALQDYIEALRFAAQLNIDGTVDTLPTALVTASIDLNGLLLHQRLENVLAGPTLDRKALSLLLTFLGSNLAKVKFAARRSQFIVRHKFSRVGQDDLLYVPKARTWSMPAKYRDARGVIGQLIRHEQLIPAEGVISVPEVFLKCVAMPLETGVGHLLKQLPHDWYLPVDFRASLLPSISGLPVGKDSVRNPANARRLITSQAARLRGPSTYLNQLSDMFLPNKTESKEWMLILDWVYRSRIVIDGDGVSIVAELERCRPRVAVPIEDKSSNNDVLQLFDRIVAVDLGERQIGYAVFDVNSSLSVEQPGPVNDPITGKPAVGALRVPGVRQLIGTVRTHRGRQAGNTKLKQNFDTRLAQHRENVTAEITQRIEALCSRFNAFPVLESSVVNFQTGSRQLDLVYGDVVRTFAFSDVKAHQAKRSEHWLGADKWVHPYLMAGEYDEATRKRGGKAKPLNLFPGATVNPAGTSQTCVHCARNAVEALKSLGEGKITVGHGGTVVTSLGLLVIMRGTNYPEHEFKQARRRKLNLPLNVPLSPGTYPTPEVMTALRRTMRQKNPHVMARDTTQSRFQCTFGDCGATYHADEGAAINIGRKFFRERIDRKASLAKLEAAS